MLYVLLAFELVVFSSTPVAVETTYAAENFFPYSEYCGGAQDVIRVTDNTTCTKITCFTDGNNTVRTECHEDYMEDIRLSFGDEYIVQKVYKDSDCTTFSYAIGYRVTDTCASGYYESKRLNRFFYYVARLNDDGSAKIEFFSDSDCNSPYYFSIDNYITGDITTKYVTKNDDCVYVERISWLLSMAH